MENIKINYNKLKENFEQTKSKQFLKNSINFLGICDASTFELCDKSWNEITLKSSINIPDSYDPIDQIDSINSSVEITESKVIATPSIPRQEPYIKNFENKLTTGRKLIVSGCVHLSINYVSIYKDKNVQGFAVKIPFSNFIVLPKNLLLDDETIDPMNVEFLPSACVEDINIGELEAKNLKFTINVILTACHSKCIKSTNINRFKKCKSKSIPEIYGLCSKTILNNLLVYDLNSMKYWNQISLSKICTLPMDKPDIIQILSVNSKIKVINQKVIDTPKSDIPNLNNLSLTGKKLIINGLLIQNINYISKTDSQEVISSDIIIPLSSYIMLPKDYPCYNKFNLCLCLEDINLCALNNRQIFSSATIFLKAKL